MIWYPYEQLKTMKAPYEIVDANGVYLYTKDQKLIDSVSSWWSVIHGYKHPVINQAIISQVEKFSHVMLGGLTHEPARRLSEKLASWLPGDLDYCFFSDSGSVAVEVALKMALQYYMNRGDEKRTMQPETSRTNRRSRKMIVNRGWQESTTTKEETQALNRNINEQKKQTVETLRQTIKEWDIARSYVVRYHFNEDATETMQEKIKRMPVAEASRMAVY